MDIRKKGVIGMLIYNVLGVLSIYPMMGNDPFFGGWGLYLFTFTFPIIFFSYIYRFVASASDPLYPILIIQFVMFIVTAYILDLKLRNYSPAYIEKKRIKFVAEKQREFNTAITDEQVSIYLKYRKTINDLTQTATPEEKVILSVEQWHSIDNIVKDVLLIKKGQVSSSTKNSIEKRIKEKLRDEASFNLLYTIE